MFGKQAPRIGAILMAIVLASAGSAIADQGAQTGRRSDQCRIWARAAQVREGDSSPGARRRNGGPSFSATEIVDIDFQVRFAPRNGDRPSAVGQSVHAAGASISADRCPLQRATSGWCEIDSKNRGLSETGCAAENARGRRDRIQRQQGPTTPSSDGPAAGRGYLDHAELSLR